MLTKKAREFNVFDRIVQDLRLAIDETTDYKPGVIFTFSDEDTIVTFHDTEWAADIVDLVIYSTSLEQDLDCLRRMVEVLGDRRVHLELEDMTTTRKQVGVYSIAEENVPASEILRKAEDFLTKYSL